MTDGNDSEAGSDAPPPPPPPPPPPQSRPAQPLKPTKKKDFREILTLFHEDKQQDTATTKRVWLALWQATLAEAQDEHKRRRQKEQHGLKRKKAGEHDHAPMRGGPGSLSRHGSMVQDHLKRARQGSSASTDSSESIKAGRLGGRFLKNAPKGSKLLQKFGGRN